MIYMGANVRSLQMKFLINQKPFSLPRPGSAAEQVDAITKAINEFTSSCALRKANLSGSTARITSLKNFKLILTLLLSFSITPIVLGSNSEEHHYTGELHPPVIASRGDDKIVVFLF